VRQTTSALAANQALLLKRAKGRAGVFYVLPGAGAFSGGLLSEAGDLAFLDTLEGIENGKIRALLAVESDPFFHLLDLKRLEQAVSKLDFLVVMDHVPSRFARCAHVFLPTSTMFEAPMSFVNQEGRLQRSEAVHSGGTPVAQDGAGDHPPRIYGRGVPGSDPKAAWKALADIGRALSLPEEELPGDDPLKHFAQDYPPFGRLQAMDFPPEGARILHGPDDITRSADAAAIPPRSDEPMELLLVDWTFGTEELSSYSDHIRKVEKEPVLFMHGADAAREGLSDGDVVLVSLQDEPWLRVKLNLADNMARGVLILPRHRRLEFLNQKSFSPPAPPGSMKVTIRRSVDQDALRGWILARSL
jgi:NADH-quinone oxidoreductase subunit G